MKNILYFLFLNILSSFSRRNLKRIPEPDLLTTGEKEVEEYNNTLGSSLSIMYIYSLEIILNNVRRFKIKKGIDVCCGPAIFTQLLAQNLIDTNFVAIDLSDQMLVVAEKNF